MHPLSPREVSPPGYIRPRAPDLPPTAAEIDRQRHWEAKAVEAGIRRYRAAVRNLAMADTSPGQRIIREIMAKFVPYLADIQAMEREGFYKPGRSEEWILLLHLLPPETLAFLTLRAVMGERPSNEDHLRTFSACAGSLATMIETEAAFLELKDEVRAEKREARALGQPYEDVIEKMKRTNKVIDRRAFRNMEKACGRLERQGWPNTLRIQLGGKLIEHMVDCTGGAYFEIGTAYTGVVARKAGKAARKTPRVIRLTPKARELIEDQHARMELLTPIRRPMKCPPKPWEWDDRRGCYVGGYYQIPDSGRIHGGWGGKHTAALTRPLSEETLRAVNTLQDTPWQINRDVFEVMEEARLGGLPELVPPADNKPLPPRLPDEEWAAMSATERQEYLDELAEIHGENASLEGKRYSWHMKLDMARQLLAEPRIWFPWYADFRGRLYPEVTDLTPQGNDASKALLRFAHGKPLGKDGRWWLYIRAANCYAAVEGPVAVDKQVLADRYQWTESNLDRISEAVESPLDGTRWWTEAKDDPWCFLATCFEIAEALQLDNPEQFISHLPVNLDGSCNGLQHLAAMGRDRAGCEATNVIPAKDRKRRDIYDEVKASVQAQVTIDAGAGDEMAKLWLGEITRKTVKRAVMTTPYGVTDRGMATQLIEDGWTDGMGQNKRSAANYLQNCIVKALDKRLGNAKRIMAWLQAVAEALAKHSIPFRWRTPTGNEIEQAYWQQGEQRVITLHGKISLWADRPGTELQLAKQKQAAAPNIVHSFDASHLVRTINACADGWLLKDFSAIHDSYGVHAGDASVLGNILRRELARMYETNWLQEIEDYVRSYAPAEVEIPSWTEYVTLGDLDLARETPRADYAFA